MVAWEIIPAGILRWAKYFPLLTAAFYGWLATYHSDKLHRGAGGTKKHISGLGWLGIGCLAAGALLGLASSCHDERETASVRRVQENEMQAALDKLGSIGEKLSKTSQVVEKSAADSQKSASALEVLVNRSDANVKTTSEILRESKMSVSVYNLRVVVTFDAIAFDDQLHRTLLAPDLRALLETGAPLSTADQNRIVDVLNDHRRQVLELLFQRWEMSFHLMKRYETGKRDEVGPSLYAQDLVFPGDEGASAYFTPPDNSIRTPQGRIAAGCLIRYTVSLVGIPGLRTFKDLNGAKVSFLLKAVPGSIGLKGAYAYLGYGGSGAYRERDELAIYMPSGEVAWTGRWTYSTLIPRDKYQMP